MEDPKQTEDLRATEEIQIPLEATDPPQEIQDETSLVAGDPGVNYETLKSNTSGYSNKHLTEDDKKRRTTSYYYSLATLFKGYIGISFLALPSGFIEIGIIGVFIDFPLILIVNLYSINLLIKTRNKYKHLNITNLSDLTNAVYGGVQSRVSDVFIILLQGSFAIIYTMYIGDQLDLIFCDMLHWFECGHTIIYRYIYTCLMFPIIFKRQFYYFAKFSVFASIITILCIIFIIGIEVGTIAETKTVASDLKIFDLLQLPMYFGQTMCIYEGNGMLLNFYAQVEEPKLFMRQIYIVLTTITVCSLVMGIFSYLCYGNNLEEMITYNMPNTFCGISVKIFYMIAIMGVYVLSLVPVFGIIEKYEWYQEINLKERPKLMLERAGVVLICATISLMLPDITTSLSLGGSIAGVIISILIPALLYNKAFQHSEKRHNVRRFNYVFIILGIVFGCFGALESILEMILKMLGITV